MCTFNTSRLFHSEISNLLSLNLYISEASQKRPDGLQDEESALQKKMKSSKSYVILHSKKKKPCSVVWQGLNSCPSTQQTGALLTELSRWQLTHWLFFREFFTEDWQSAWKKEVEKSE